MTAVLLSIEFSSRLIINALKSIVSYLSISLNNSVRFLITKFVFQSDKIIHLC